VDRFKNETEVLSQLDHPSILKSMGSGSFTFDDTEMPWMLMELGGYNLGIHVNGNAKAKIDPKGPIVGDQFKTAALNMCDALDYVHQQGLIHRDIKPGNFVWKKRFEYDSISLIDFGLCKHVGADTTDRPFDQITLDHEVVGPRMLFSPELCRYATDKTTLVDHRSDMWQLARVFWFMATGHLSTGRPTKRLDPFGGSLHAICDEMCHDDPDDRIQTMDELRSKIDAIAT